MLLTFCPRLPNRLGRRLFDLSISLREHACLHLCGATFKLFFAHGANCISLLVPEYAAAARGSTARYFRVAFFCAGWRRINGPARGCSRAMPGRMLLCIMWNAELERRAAHMRQRYGASAKTTTDPVGTRGPRAVKAHTPPSVHSSADDRCAGVASGWSACALAGGVESSTYECTPVGLGRR